MTIDRAREITPPHLLVIDCKIAYAKRKYHSDLI